MAAVEQPWLPHLLFYGPPGTGKTTCALAVVRQLFGAEQLKNRVLELNASDERGIAVVRSKIKTFAAIAVGQQTTLDGARLPPYKVIILDEADAMTNDAQSALRRTMEVYSKVTRFIIICNYVSRIIEPLASRCAKFRFKPMHGDVIHSRIEHICTAEGVELSPGTLQALSKVAGGDMRRAITTLQSAARLGGKGGVVDAATVHDVAGVVPEAACAAIAEACKSGSFAAMQASIEHTVLEGYPAQEILLGLQAVVLQDQALDNAQKAIVLEALAVADKALVDGADELLQLLSVGSQLQTCLSAMQA
ncbi:hypothetical protein QBZ16_000949 [Prototheca wickerhamii]|uniref:AAA+ ATPase domain-containing protein n=1 Tax=Prototheca wickerhamii TaxID=3111 RepID=A0AAD9MGA7_PROWI|nr:hypothetical protein QBZ16_000949 [Prototheca wickerhamii]